MNQLAEDAKKAEAAAAAPPSDDTLRKELEAERIARAEAERKAGFFQGAAASEWKARQDLAARGRQPNDPLTDPYAKLSAEDALLDPEKKAQLLDQGARGRAREEVGRFAAEERARRAGELQELESRMALRMFQSQNPEIAADEEGFAAAMMKAKIRADKKQLNLDPMGLLELGRQVYNEGKVTPQETPFVEGPSGASGPGGRVKKEEPEQSMAEKYYGAQDFIDEDKMPVSDYTEKFLDERNLQLVDKEKFWSGIRNVQGDIQAAKQRRRSAGR